MTETAAQPDAGSLHPALRAVGQDRRADIQGMRGLAVLLVAVFHAGWRVPGGFIGVDVFFVISGFVITNLLWAELSVSGRLRLGHFYARRIKRLLPALAVLLVATAAASVLLTPISTQRTGAITGLAASAFAANLYLSRIGSGYFATSTTLIPLLHTWTLAVEEQFYLAFPILLVVAQRLARRGRSERARRRTVAAVIALVTLASFALSVRLTYGGPLPGVGLPKLFAFYSSPTRAWEFGVGSLLALARPRLPRVAALAVGAAGLATVLGGAWLIDGQVAFPGVAALVPVVGAAALLAAGASTDRGVSGLLALGPLTWLGDVSYSWYLWHWPAIVFARALWPNWGMAATVAAATSLLPAAASHRFVEQPVRGASRIRGWGVVAVAAVCVAVPVAAAGGLLAANRVVDRTAAGRAWLQTQQFHADTQRGCDGLAPLGGKGRERCTWTVPSSVGTVVLLGDSNAGHFSEPFVQAANDLGLDATVATQSSCPFIEVRVHVSVAGESWCRDFVARSLEELVRTRPNLVVLAARTTGYIENRRTGIGSPDGPVRHDPGVKARIWQTGLTNTLHVLNRAGIPVLVVHPVPSFAVTPDECAVLWLLRGPCAQVESRGSVDAAMRRSLLAERSAVAAASDAGELDTIPFVCDDRRCSTQRGGISMYRDNDHLSVPGALTFTGAFTQGIEALARRGA